MNEHRPKTVVVTGSSAGVGRATAVAFGRLGMNVALLARGRERLDAAAATVEQAGGRALVVTADVADYSQVESAAHKVEAHFGPIDIWVNNAMATIFSPFVQIQPDEYRRATEVTYLGTVFGTMAALRRMMPRNRGTIVQVGSALAYRAIPLQSPYCGAKHAVRGFTDSLRAELLHDHIDVHLTMVQLPALNTPQFEWALSRLPKQTQPVPPIFQPEVAARAIVWAALHRRRELYVGSPTAAAVLASRMFPGLVDRYLGLIGYESQETDRPRRPDRPSNLFAPPEGDYGTHGPFDPRSRTRSFHTWATTHLPLPALVDAAAGVWGVSAAMGTFLTRQVPRLARRQWQASRSVAQRDGAGVTRKPSFRSRARRRTAPATARGASSRGV